MSITINKYIISADYFYFYFSEPAPGHFKFFFFFANPPVFHCNTHYSWPTFQSLKKFWKSAIWQSAIWPLLLKPGWWLTSDRFPLQTCAGLYLICLDNFFCCFWAEPVNHICVSRQASLRPGMNEHVWVTKSESSHRKNIYNRWTVGVNSFQDGHHS